MRFIQYSEVTALAEFQAFTQGMLSALARANSHHSFIVFSFYFIVFYLSKNILRLCYCPDTVCVTVIIAEIEIEKFAPILEERGTICPKYIRSGT